MERNSYILQMQGITKEFPGVRALDDVNLNVHTGSIHAICGENGAGKSTLMKVLSGVYPYGTYDGKIIYMGQEMKFKNIKESEHAGIAIIHQELTMIPELSITENIFMGNEITHKGLINWAEERARTSEILKKVGLTINPDTLIKHLGVGQQQLVEIAKALSKNVKLLILDEPTSALNEADSANLLELMKGLRDKGITCIMISHKLNEIAEVSDAVTVIRDGHTVESYDVEAGKVDEDQIIKSMVGRSIENRYPEHEPKIGDIIFEVKNWCIEDPEVAGRMVCKNSSFNVRAGEIVGFAGLMGAGRTELMRSIFGKNYGIYRGGSIKIKGREVTLNSVEQAIKNGIAYVPEDRKNLGLNLLDSIRKTVVSADLDKITKGGLLSPDMEQSAAEEYRKSLKIKTSSIDVGVTTLSGGNQQKVVLSKWMFTEPDILILDEPTRGIDVGAKYEIYKLIHQLADQGKAVILVSSELPELLGMADRIYTIFEGTITGEMMSYEANQESLMKKMTITSNS
ncbi:ATP-binding cassette domain-containing protein [Pseudobutyrivibrio xylanivorans]|uniref:Putative multiple sugar transport system ATP-binding protein n=2 Tax=Pseudobutyrivibrio xylanivorans TaxID=185007 RepID=A0A1M5ZZS4_PSEXY|nr:ATP-binding cassette domain-containing protein [Pseudobutyrivibrio xylanivorans]SCZ76768.1 putative multiple sugar transport system ATP-binding protein [Pseudobutyrivibrio xylanivorans]SHI29742.1 putative multiple sugar transport system ATP-binding protein [Pseudobutyrivibrio xylanivorans DSM 14809]